MVKFCLRQRQKTVYGFVSAWNGDKNLSPGLSPLGTETKICPRVCLRGGQLFYADAQTCLKSKQNSSSALELALELGDKLSPNLSPDLSHEKFVLDLSPDLSPGLPHEKFVSDLFPWGVVFVSDRDKSLSPDLSPRRSLGKF